MHNDCICILSIILYEIQNIYLYSTYIVLGLGFEVFVKGWGGMFLTVRALS